MFEISIISQRVFHLQRWNLPSNSPCHISLFFSFSSFFLCYKDRRSFVGLWAWNFSPVRGRNCRNRNIQRREAEQQFQKLLTCPQTPFSLFSAPVISFLRVFIRILSFFGGISRGTSSRKIHRRYSISVECVYRSLYNIRNNLRAACFSLPRDANMASRYSLCVRDLIHDRKELPRSVNKTRSICHCPLDYPVKLTRRFNPLATVGAYRRLEILRLWYWERL